MEWVKEINDKPDFGKLVLCYCRIYGYFLGSYNYIDLGYGNWRRGAEFGILPPVYWAILPEEPRI